MDKQSLVVGLGCERGVKKESVVIAVRSFLRRQGFSPEQVDRIATIELKNDETGLLEAAEILDVPIVFFEKEELLTVSPPNPNPEVKKAVGVSGVAESSAMLASGAESLLREKKDPLSG